VIMVHCARAWETGAAGSWNYATGKALPFVTSKGDSPRETIRTYAMTRVAADGDGTAMLSDLGLPLEVRKSENGVLLVVKVWNQDDGSMQQRYLAHPVDAADTGGVRLVNEPGPGCEWTRHKIATAATGVRAEWDVFL